MNVLANLKYAESHEWVEDLGNGKLRIGITDYAQETLGNLVFVNLPEVGDAVTSGDSFADVESVKAVSDIISPADGTVSAINDKLLDSPELINDAPYEAWFIEIENAKNLGNLMTAAEYEKFVASLE